MAIRDFGPRHGAIDEALRRLEHISRAEADAISAAYAAWPLEAWVNARINCQITSRNVGRQRAWAAARAYGGDSARGAAYYVEHLHYASVRPGSMPWGLLREAYRDAAAAAVVADVADPTHIDILVGPIIRVLPNLRRALTGR